MIVNADFNRPPRCSIVIHKRQVGSVNSVSETFGFGHEHSKLERLIL